MLLFVEVNQQRWLEESGQRLENVDRTHLALASGKLVLQKVLPCRSNVSWIIPISAEV